MRLLVTGGAGFIGSNFIRFWLDRHASDEIINLDKLTYAGNTSSLKDCCKRKNYRFVRGDICNVKLVEKVMRGVDVVVHFAAETHVDRSILDPSVFVRTNVLGTQVLLEAALKAGVRRFHHISTDEVFGSLEIGSKEKFNENTRYNPRSPYAASKAASDHLVRAYFHTFRLPITITNCSNNFGPYQNPEKFIPRMITDLILDRKVKIYGDGQYFRDWLHVEDHIRAIEVVIEKGKSGETYLVGGTQKDISNLEVAKMIISHFGKKAEDCIEFVKDRPGHDRRYAIDWSKINKELGWKPIFDVDRWFFLTVKWYKENTWWWMPLKEKAEKIYK